MVNAALIAGTCIGVFIGVLLSVLLVIIALCYFGICKWPEDSESDNERERDTRNAREYKGIPLHSCVPRLSAEELEMRNKAIAKYKRRKAREERREARQRRREERQARAALLIALAKEKLDNEMMQKNSSVDRNTHIECNNNETVATTENVLTGKVDTLASKINMTKTENNINRSENDNGTNVPTMSREELEALSIEQAHRTFTTSTTAAAAANNTVNNTQTSYANENSRIISLDRRPSLNSSISASTLTTSVSTSVLTSSAIAYGRGAYLPHDELYENSVLTVNTATMNKLNSNNNNNQHENSGVAGEEEEEYWPRGMGSASNVQEEDLHHIDIPYYFWQPELEENNYNDDNNYNDNDNIEMQSRRSSASRGTLATIKSYVKQLGSRVRARQRRKARRQWQSENEHDLNSEDVDIFNQWETSLPSSSSSSSSSSSESESESELPANESMLTHDVNTTNQEKLTSDVHDTTNGIHNTISNTNNINHFITPALTTTTTINVEESKNTENKQTKEINEAKNKKRKNTKANKEQRHHHRHHKRRHNNRNITNEDEDVNNDNDDDTHSVASSAPRPPDEILKNYPFLCMNNNNRNSNINKDKTTHTTIDDTEKGIDNNNTANDNTHNMNKINAKDFLSECQDSSTKHLGHVKEMQTAELPDTHQKSDVDASTGLHKETADELQEQHHHQVDEANTQEKQTLSLSVQSVNNNDSNTLRTPPEHEPTFNISEHTALSSSSESELELTPEQEHKQTLHKSHKTTKQQKHSHHHHHRDQEEKERSQSQTHRGTTVKDYQRKKWTGRDVEHNVAMSGFFTTPLQQRDMMYYSNSYNTNDNIGINNTNNNNHHGTTSNWRAETSRDACADNVNSKEYNNNSPFSSVIVNNNNEQHDDNHISRSDANDTESSGNDDDTKNKAAGHTYHKS